MAVFVNSMHHVVHMVGYRADGLKFDQKDPDIQPGQARYVNQDHFGDNDWYIMVAYMKDAEIPDRIGVTQSTSGGGGSLGLTIAGFGGSVGASGSGTTYYSDGLAIVKTRPHELWQVVEDSNNMKWAFLPGGEYTSNSLHGW